MASFLEMSEALYNLYFYISKCDAYSWCLRCPVTIKFSIICDKDTCDHGNHGFFFNLTGEGGK